MELHEFERFLKETLEDGRLSRAERKVLRELLTDRLPDRRQLALFRDRAFELAREAVTHRNGRDVLDWLESVIRALQPSPRVDRRSRVAEAWFSPHSPCHRRIVGLFAEARTSADICVFTITDDRVSEAILDAHARGVVVRVISDDEKASDRGSDIGRIERAGVLVAVDRSEHHMHHKFALFDGRLLITGSYNWTRSAADFNRENLVVTDEPKLVTAFGEEFERLWRQLSSGP